MTIEQSFIFNTPTGFNRSNVSTSATEAKLSLIPNPGQIFSELFSSDVGFTYDSARAEFNAGILRQKDLRPNSSVLAATYTSSKNLNWSSAGSLIGTDIGAPLLAAGKLSCLGGGNNGVRYESADIGASGNVGAMKIKYTPNYSGTPPTNYNIFEFAPAAGSNDRMLVFHSSTGTLRLTAYTSVGTVKHSAVAFGGVWSPVAGTEYEIELDWDTVAGVVRLFVNGVLDGSMPVSSYARGSDADRLYVGAGAVYTATDAYFNDVILFGTVQHTVGYASGYSIPEYIYAGSKIDGPNFSYSGVGTVLSVDDGTVTEAGSPRYIIGLKYWNGSAWVDSDGSYAQANDFATALANFGSFVASGGILPWSIVFTDSNTLSSVDEFSVEVTGEKYATDGYVEPTQPIQAMSISDYSDTRAIDSGDNDIKIVLKDDGVFKYWNGTAWVASNGTYAQSNTVAEIVANIATLDLGNNSSVFVRWNFHTDVVTLTPQLIDATISYEFGAVDIAVPTCLVYGYLKDIQGLPVASATLTFNINTKKNNVYNEGGNSIVMNQPVVVTTDAFGYFSLNLIRATSLEGVKSYKVSIAKSGITMNKNPRSDITFQVPDSDMQDITDLIATLV